MERKRRREISRSSQEMRALRKSLFDIANFVLARAEGRNFVSSLGTERLDPTDFPYSDCLNASAIFETEETHTALNDQANTGLDPF